MVPRAELRTVYNLEVAMDHVNCVGADGLGFKNNWNGETIS